MLRGNSIGIKILAAIITLLLLPFLIIIGIAVYYSIGEFPIFTQKRAITLEHHLFTIYKYRTIKKHKPQIPSDSILNKPGLEKYVTRLGSQLRKTGFDEILQLLNVIKGDMAFIGPRPLSVEDITIIKKNYPELYNSRAKLTLKPGITGLWQVIGQRDLGIYNLVKHDLFYANNRSLKLNVKILGLTIKTILTRTHSDAVLNFRENLFDKKLKNINLIIPNSINKKA